MLTITFSFIQWLGFDLGYSTQYAGTKTHMEGRIQEVYRVTTYYLSLGCIQLAFTGGKSQITEAQMEKEIEENQE